jgi:RsiW-degrading membrane proteinase PrsW (M82 family)
MTVLLDPVSTRPARAWPLHWAAVLLAGVTLFAALLAVAVNTRDPIYLPCLLLLGAAVVPATLTTFVAEVERAHGLSFARLTTAAVLGGVVAGILAGQLEADVSRTLGSLPFLTIGLVEESAKLAVAVLVARRWRPRPGPAGGLVLGVAVGSGFAAMETMGYAFVALVNSHGQLQAVDSLLLMRAFASLGGHAVWTGLACSAWYAVRSARKRRLGQLRWALTFTGVICLHAWWDASAHGFGYLAVAAVGVGLLGATGWCLRNRSSSAALPA